MPDVTLSFSVGITDGSDTKQEKRTLDFYLCESVDISHGRGIVHSFFKQLVGNLPGRKLISPSFMPATF